MAFFVILITALFDTQSGGSTERSWIVKLRVIGGSVKFIVGTPWHGFLYLIAHHCLTFIRYNENDSKHSLLDLSIIGVHVLIAR